jgi:hypothetical protein
VEVCLEGLIQHERTADADGEERGDLALANEPNPLLFLADEQKDRDGGEKRGDEDLDGANEGKDAHEAGEGGRGAGMDCGLYGEIEGLEAGERGVKEGEGGACGEGVG